MNYNKHINKVIGKKIRAAIDERGYYYNTVANHIGISSPSLTQIIKGKQTCSIETIFLLSQFLYYPISYFIDTTEIRKEIYKHEPNPQI